MPRNIVRSTLFNLLFYILTALACVVCLPTLVLPRRYFMGVVHGFVRGVYFLERVILGLDLEIRGRDNVPKSGPYIIAAKHQSAYETLKLHLLFKDPAVILKRELLRIPLWGLYLKKSDPIAIDRKNPESAISSIQEGAQRVAAQGRPIIIFPQGTRVNVAETSADRPYKVGVARVQEATGLPIVPLALNAGMFWPKHGWLKSSGQVVISFLSPVEAGQERKDLIKALENEIEGESLSLMNEARESVERDSGGRAAKIALSLLGIGALVAFGAYSFLWFKVAKQAKREYVAMMQSVTRELPAGSQTFDPPKVSGYPGKMHLFVEREAISNARGGIVVENLRAAGWPLPLMPIDIKTGTITLSTPEWRKPLVFDSLTGEVTFNKTLLHISRSLLTKQDFNISVTGDIDMEAVPAPLIDLVVDITEANAFLTALGQSGIIEPQMAAIAGAGLASFGGGNGKTSIPIHQKDFTLFAGPLPIMRFDQPSGHAQGSASRLRRVP